MSQISKPARDNPDLRLNAGEIAQLTMFKQTVDGSSLRQKESLLIGARLDGFANICEGKVQVLNVRLRPVHWPEVDVHHGSIRFFPRLDLRTRTLIALQEGYKDLESFVKDYTRPKAADIRKAFIEGTATLYWHQVDPKLIRPWKQQ